MAKNVKAINFVEEVGMDPKKRAKALDQTKWANDFTWAEIETLASYLRLFQVPKDFLILKEGEKDPFVAIIIEGTVGVYKEDPNNQPKMIAALGSGQTIGEMAMIDRCNCSATVSATTDVALLTMTQDSFNNLINEKPSLAVKFILKLSRILSQKLRLTSGNLVDLL